MRPMTRVCGSLFAVGLAGLWGSEARASLGGGCQTECTYVPARYLTGANGDVALTANSGTGANMAMAPIATELGLTWYHAKILVDNTGQNFAETYWGGINPPSSKSSGEPDICSKVLSPFGLQRMTPGAGTYYEDAMPGELVKGFGKQSCTVPADGYRFDTFLHDTQPCPPGDTACTNAPLGGSCEKELVDYCAVPVNNALTTAGGDRIAYSSLQVFNALNNVFSQSYQSCMEVIGYSYITFLGIDGIGCGGTSEQTMCQRMGWQVVNEILNMAYPLQYWGLGACDGNNCGYMDGWSDFDIGGAPPVVEDLMFATNPPANYNVWNGRMLGAAKTNGQNYLTPSASAPTNAPLVPGACDDGSCNNAPINWAGAPNEPQWAPNNQTANVPDNIAHAAARLGKTVANGGIVPVSVGSGIQAGVSNCKIVCPP